MRITSEQFLQGGQAKLFEPNPMQQQQVQDTGYFSDLWGDIKETGSAIGETIQQGGERMRETGEAAQNGEQNVFSTLGQFGANAIGAVGGVVGDVVTGGMKALAPQSLEDKVSDVAKGALSSVWENLRPELKQDLSEAKANYDNLAVTQPETKRNLDALLNGIMGATELEGVGQTGRGLKTAKELFVGGTESVGGVAKNVVKKGQNTIGNA